MANYIIVPVDGSPLAEQAIPLAVAFAKKTNDTLMLLRVVAQTRKGDMGDEEDQRAIGKSISLRNNVMHQYFHTLEPYVRQADVTVETCIEEGVPGDAIVTVAERHDARFVVMTTHGRTGIGRWSIGSVADRVLRQIDCPLVLLRPREPFVSTLGTPRRIRNILVPLDGSSLSEAVLPVAREVAKRFDATIHLFHAVSPMPFALSELEGANVRAHLRTAERQNAQAHLDTVAHDLEQGGLTVQAALGDGFAADAILLAASQKKADLIAMATHARMGLRRTLLGSVTDRVVRAGELPVLIVRPQEGEEGMTDGR